MSVRVHKTSFKSVHVHGCYCNIYLGAYILSGHSVYCIHKFLCAPLFRLYFSVRSDSEVLSSLDVGVIFTHESVLVAIQLAGFLAKILGFLRLRMLMS